MRKPITLWRPRTTLASDDACTTILKYALPMSTVLAPYTNTSQAKSNTLRYVPSLAYFCIEKLLDYADQIYTLGSVRLVYEPTQSPEEYDILCALIPSYRGPQSGDFDLSQVDPRLWAVLIQLYSNIPSIFRMYTISLSDEHLPLLQRIPSTPNFAIITILELPGCRELTDDTVIQLKVLHGLGAFDASGTALSAWGLERLSKTLTFAEVDEESGALLTSPRKGPWGIRILNLRNCMNIKNDIFDHLTAFPLLSVVDLRGTCCTQNSATPFRPSHARALYYPVPLIDALSCLSQLYPVPHMLFSHPEPYIVRIDSLHYKQPDPRLSHIKNLLAKRFSEGIPTLQGRKDVFLPYISRAPSPSIYEDGETSVGDDRAHLGSGSTTEEDMDEHHISYESVTGLLGMSCAEEDGAALQAKIAHHRLSKTTAEETYIDDPKYGSVREAPCSPALEDQNAVAAIEARLHVEHQSAMRFYGASSKIISSTKISPQSKVSTVSTLPRTRICRAYNSEATERPSHKTDLDPMMLFRPPPSWNALPTSRAEAQGRGDNQKRKRVKNCTILGGGMIRAAWNNIQVKEDMAKLRTMMETRRASTAAALAMPVERSFDGGAKKVARANPFSRNALSAAGASSSSRGARIEQEAVSSPRFPGVQGSLAGSNPSRSVRDNTASTAPHLKADRPLIPISKLPVPILPLDDDPKHKSKRQLGPAAGQKHARSSRVGGTQTTLATFVQASRLSSTGR